MAELVTMITDAVSMMTHATTLIMVMFCIIHFDGVSCVLLRLLVFIYDDA